MKSSERLRELAGKATRVYAFAAPDHPVPVTFQMTETSTGQPFLTIRASAALVIAELIEAAEASIEWMHELAAGERLEQALAAVERELGE